MGHYTPCFKFTLLKALLISTKPALHCILPQRKLVHSIHKHQIQLGAYGGWWFPQNIENTQTKPHQLFLAVKYSNMCVCWTFIEEHKPAPTSHIWDWPKNKDQREENAFISTALHKATFHCWWSRLLFCLYHWKEIRGVQLQSWRATVLQLLDASLFRHTWIKWMACYQAFAKLDGMPKR